MLDFSWNQWLNAAKQFTGMNKSRKPRRARTARIEVLEERALLTANLPVAVGDIYSVNQDTTLNGSSVLANDTDADGDTISQATLQNNVTHGTLTLQSNGTFTYVPNAGYTGTDSFTYFAVDSANAETSLNAATVTIHVGIVNSLPTVAPVTLTTPLNTALTGTLTGVDANGDPLTFSAGSTAATNGTVVINPNGSFTFTPTTGFTGPATFSFKASDGIGNSTDATATVNVGSVVNVAPVGTAATISTATGVAFTGNLAATDANGDTLTYSAGTTAAAHGTVVINPNGSFTYTPTAGFTGTDSFSFTANDGSLTSANSLVTVHVGVTNSLPVVTPVTLTTPLNTSLNGTLTAVDANGDPLTFSAGSTAATNGTVVINPDGSFTFTPTTGFTGAATFSFKANDGIGNSTDATATVNVGSVVNVAPVGTTATISTATGVAFTGNLAATDANGDTLTYAAGTTAAAHGTVVINPNGSFTYTPTAGFTGTDSFSFTANDGSLTSANTLVTVHVGVTNTLPVVTPVTLTTPLNTSLNGTLTAVDANGDPLTFSAGSTAATNGTVVINPDGSFTFTPTTGFTGAATFSFKANDGIGNSTDATATVNVGSVVNVAPVGTAATISTATGVAFTGNLAATDANGDTLTYSAGTTAAAHGTVVINPNGSFTYTPAAGFTGTDSFSFKASDGTLTSANTLVTVHVGVTNTLPVVTPVTLTTPLNTALSGTLTAVDANGDPLTFSAGSTAATNGTVVINPDGSFTFTPTTGFTGPATFSFKANDGIGNSTDATATVNVGSVVNVAPVGTAATISTATGVAFTGNLAATDANGDTLTYSAGTTAAAHGTVVINPNGSFTYTPAAGFTGTDSFSFKASDGTLTSANTLVTVHVGVTNTLPVVTPVTLTTPLNTALTGTLTAVDANGDPLTFSAGSTAATNGTVVINPNGTFTFTPTTGFTGPATFSFKANDGIGNSTDAIATVNVGSVVNVAPVGTAATISTATGVAFTGNLAATDANGDTLTYSAGTTAAAHGTVVINPNGSFTYTPAAGFTGTDSFSFKASDGTLTSANTLVTVHVGVTNSLPVVTPVTLTTPLNTALTGTLTAVDANGDPLTFSAGSTAATNGTVVINPNGTFTFTPTTGFTGPATFSFKANDGIGNSTDATATVNVGSVVNTAPVVITGTGTTAFGTDLVSTLTTLATDAEGNTLTYAAVTQPAHGTLSLSPDGTFTYTPDAGFNGTDSFTFKANDGTSDSNVGTFNITVSPSVDLITLNLASTGTIATKLRSVQPLDANATLTNVDPSVNFGNTTIIVSLTDGADSRHDQLRITKVRGSNLKGTRTKVTINGSQVATVSGGRRGQPLQISFNSNATQADVTAVLQRIGAKTTRNSNSGPRTAQVQVNAGAASATESIVLTKV